MHYRRLGRTELEVSVVGFGASAMGGVFGEISLNEAQDAVAGAIESGINLFDVAPYYGLTLAEERLGNALRGKRSQVLLATKCGRYGADHFDFSAKTITARFHDSLHRLNTDYVDLLQAHDIEFGDRQQILQETLPAMLRLRDEGKVRYVGVTGYWPGMLADIAQETPADCVLTYCHANLFVDDIQQELLPAARATGFGVLNASPLHMGLLGGREVPEWHPAPLEVRQAAEQVNLLCTRAGVDPATLALRASLDFEGVASTLVGIRNRAELTAALAALDWKAPDELWNAVHERIAPVHNRTWASGRVATSDAAK